MKLKAGGKAVIAIVVVGALGFGANMMGYFESAPVVASSVPTAIDLPTGDGKETVRTSSNISLPAANSSGVIKINSIPWNATSGLNFANGGPQTTSGSLIANRGLKVNIERQDDYSQMISAHVAFDKAFRNGSQIPSEGIAFSIIMGDGYPGYVASAKRAGVDLQVVTTLGYSRGEDRCMGPAEVKQNPQKARGILIAGVPRDGDLHICFKWATDNNIPINANPKVYDPNAINFVETSSFVEADEKLISGATETRPVVVDGKLTGERRTVKVTGTGTWFPGDEKVVRECNKSGSQCAGISSIASTQEYRYQMPSILIGNKQWMAQNPQIVQNLIAAAAEGGETVRSNDDALSKAAAINAKIFDEQDAKFWKTAFKGYTLHGVPVGGSTTNGLGDAAFLFGLQGNDNIYKRVYTVFGQLDRKYYPNEMPEPLPYEEVVNTSYLEAVLANTKQVTAAETQTYNESAKVTETFATKSYSIGFNSGKATFTGDAINTLDELLNQLSVSGLSIQIDGHTDSVGDSTSNLALSKARADAVKNWLVANAGSTFPQERIRTRGYGDAMPVADNKSASGRAQNRRVEIKMVQTN